MNREVFLFYYRKDLVLLKRKGLLLNWEALLAHFDRLLMIPDFLKKKEQLDANILVGGLNFGCGSSREQAPIAIKAAGIKCVIAPFFARIFFRNAIIH